MCLSEFIDWRYSQSYWYFRHSFVNCCPSNFLSGSTLPPPPFPVSKYSIYRQYSMWLGRGRGVSSLVVHHILQEFNTWHMTDSTYKIATPPQTKTQEGRGIHIHKHLPQSPFTGKFLQMTTFCFAVYILVHVSSHSTHLHLLLILQWFEKQRFREKY